MTTETIQKKLFTVDEFHRMSKAGILPENRRFELIRGEIIEMPTAGPPHAGRLNRLNRLFTLKLGETAIVGVQNPFPIDLHSEALPDIAILKPVDDFYQKKHPGPEDVLLLVEVSHTTVNYDSKLKAPLYAESGVPVYWQVDVKKDKVVVRTNPQAGEYHNVQICSRGESIRLQRLDFVFSVDEILGPPDE